jgi:type I restriction enzyme S subunit
MNAERLLAHYERIAGAPDAIARLRGFILDLAVRGKLVPQDPRDKPATELLKRIAAEKARLVKVGEARKSEIEPINAAEEPFHAPPSWAWTRLGLVGDWGSGSTPPRGNHDFYGGDIAWLKSGELNDNRKLSGSEETVTQLAIDKCSFRINRPGDVLIAMYGATIGKVAILAERAVTNQAVCGCTPFAGVFNQFLFLFLLAHREQFHLTSEGGAQPNISKVKIICTPFPLPPLSEQQRIVAKVDELMALCDRLEAARADREAMRDRLATASLARLNVPNPDNFQADARFAMDALPALTARPDQIKQLRQTILNLAARGKLVPQDPSEEPASELLNRIAAERADLVKRRLMRREEPLDPIQPTEQPFDVPTGWLWSRIGDAVLFTQYGTSQKSHPAEKGVSVLTMGNVQDGMVIWNNEKKIPKTSEDLPALFLNKFDILYNRTNSAELVGKTGIYLGDAGVMTFASYLIRLRPSLNCSDPRYLNIAMNAPEFRATQIIPLIKKQTGQANVNGTALKNMLLPFPPLAEQQRIVAKVAELMALCNRLEASLTDTDHIRRLLLDALLGEALAPGNDAAPVGTALELAQEKIIASGRRYAG